MRIVFAGTPGFSVPCLTALIQADGMDVVGVVSQPDRKSGRGMKLAPSAVKQAALDAGINVITPERLRGNNEAFAWLESEQADVFFQAICFNRFFQLRDNFLVAPSNNRQARRRDFFHDMRPNLNEVENSFARIEPPEKYPVVSIFWWRRRNLPQVVEIDSGRVDDNPFLRESFFDKMVFNSLIDVEHDIGFSDQHQGEFLQVLRDETPDPGTRSI